MLLSDPAPGATSASSGEDAGANRFKSGGGSGKSSSGQVYMGLTPQVTTNIGGRDSVLTGSYGQNNMARLPFMLSKNEAYDFYNGMSGKQLRDFINAGQVSGQLQDDAGFMEGQSLWKKLVDASAGLTKAGNNVSPWDVLASYMGKGPLGVGKNKGPSLWQVQYRGGRKFLVNSQTGEVKYEGPKFETTYQKTIDLTDPTTAKAIATTVFQQLMHRDPGKGELSGYGDALRTAEQQSPVVTHTTTEYDMNTGEAIGATNNTTGGFSADAKQYLAEQKIKKTKEYGAVQAATTYSNALENAIFNNPFGSM